MFYNTFVPIVLIAKIYQVIWIRHNPNPISINNLKRSKMTTITTGPSGIKKSSSQKLHTNVTNFILCFCEIQDGFHHTK